MPTADPPPARNPFTMPFWEGTAEGKLMLPVCLDCSRVHWYPRFVCPFCHSRQLSWMEASGEGAIYTYAVQHRSAGQWASQVPFVTAFIDLKEGDRMLTVLRGVDPLSPESIHIGARVKVEFEANGGLQVPYWRVVEE